MQLATMVECSRRVGDTRSRREKIELLSACLRALEPAEIETGVAFLSGQIRQGRIGLGYAAAFTQARTTPAAEAMLSLLEVDEVLGRIAGAKGRGSAGERARLLAALCARATEAEQGFLARLLVGELHQGALEGVLCEAIARAAAVDAAAVRRAAMLSGDLGAAACAALREGAPALARFGLRLLRPIEPMLAQSCDSPEEALGALGQAALELKLDGARIQIHKQGDEVLVFSRGLKNVSAAVPELCAIVRALPARELVLDGEAIALAGDGRPLPFQTTMRRFGRKLDVAELRGAVPLSPFFFDCLHADGETLIDRPGGERFAALAALVPPAQRIPRLVTADAASAAAFLADALARGHEGVMAKSLLAPYAAGNRAAEWLKIKPAHTLDLVVLAAEWGHGRRTGWLSNLHLGARNPDGTFTMLGKTFKGLTDELLRWQTVELAGREIARDAHTVFVRPELVVEVAFSDVQASPHYSGGMALRFARVKRYRPDKRAGEADTIETVRRIHQGRLSRRG